MLRFVRVIKKSALRQPATHFVRSVSSQTGGVAYTQVKEENGIREIILSDIKTRNSLTMNLMNALQQNLLQDQDCTTLRCVVISAQGPVWSSGHNLKELQASCATEKKEAFQKLVEIIKCIRQHPVPVIAKVNGVAAAAGLQLMASCDMVISTQNSKFSTPGARFGVFCSTPGIALARAIAPLRASYMLLTGLEIDAKEAYAAGLVSKLVADEQQLENELKLVTAEICKKSRAVVALGKKFFYEQLEMDCLQAYEKGVEKMCENLEMCDGQEGVNSFIEKRKPVWSHK